ncbi:MAG: tryptophan-rich sensory protein [Candidatus Peregrinibacteria bacterium]|nr:tryptophan-rich sensory protein [Candidatus Peregrinibacteria bacterium]
MSKKMKSAKAALLRKRPLGASAKRSITKIKTSVAKKTSSLRKKVLPLRRSGGFLAWLDAVSPLSILLVGLCVVLVSILSSFFIDLQLWYFSLPATTYQLSSLTFEYILTGVFGFVALSIVVLWNASYRPRMFLMWLFVLAGILHVMWSMFFFGLYIVNVSFVIALALLVLMIAIALISWRRSRYAVLFLSPYLVWLSVVTVFCGWITFAS